MEQNKETKWYPVEYSGFWQIQDCEEYFGKDMLDADDVGEEQARENAILCSQAPEWKEAAKEMYYWIELHCQYNNSTDNSRPKDLLEKYKILCKKEQ